MTPFRDAEAFRASLEQRIRNATRESGTPHDRLRKDVAFHRLVARFVAADDDRWAIKGGVALLWRVAVDARATRDVDANWRGTPDDLEIFLDQVVEQDGGDWFEFEIGPSRPLQRETEGGVRFGVKALLAGREFAVFRLDVNFVTDVRPVEVVSIRLPLLTFCGLAELEVPMISIAQHLAEKFHAVTRTYSSGDSSRAKDAFDSMLFAQTGVLPDAGSIRRAVADTFEVRETPLPPAPPSLPTSWRATLQSLLQDFELPGIENVEELERGWIRLWLPILGGDAPGTARWDVTPQSWD